MNSTLRKINANYHELVVLLKIELDEARHESQLARASYNTCTSTYNAFKDYTLHLHGCPPHAQGCTQYMSKMMNSKRHVKYDVQ